MLRRQPTVARLWLGIGLNVLLLVFFKYLPPLLGHSGLTDSGTTSTLGQLAMPVGISFWTFQALSYLFDLYREEDLDPTLLEFCLYMAFWPTVLAGPVCRLPEMLPQFRHKAPVEWNNVVEGVRRILTGLFMKVVLAQILSAGLNSGEGVAAGFDQIDRGWGGLDVWFLAIGFGFELFFDFAGYSNIVIGSALLFGIRLQENFDRPYLSTTPSVFWTRWHMSLSFWIRDYVFMPLATVRREMWWRQLALVLAMTLFGLWHGATALFLIWGAYHGLLLVGHRQVQKLWRRWDLELPDRLLSAVGWAVTTALILFGWLFFRAHNVHQVLIMVAAVFSPRTYGHLALRPNFYIVTALIVVGYFGYHGFQSLTSRWSEQVWPRRLMWALSPIRYAALLFLTIVWSKQESVFVYFQFSRESRIEYQSLVECLAAAPALRPFVTMWHSDDCVERATFGEFRQQAAVQAANFRASGVENGDIVVLIMPQGISLMAAFCGAMLLGAVPAILAYPNFKVEAAKYRTGLAGVTSNLNARFVVIDKNFPSEWLEHVKLDDSSELIRNVPHLLPSASIDNSYSPVRTESLALIQHSAGTTGLQKGVALSHAAVLRQLADLAAVLRITDADVIYSWLPLYHDMGLIACFILPLVYHLPVIMQSPTDWVMQPGTMLRLITENCCSLAWTPNFGLQFLARRVHPDDRDDFELSSLRALINCSEPVRAQSMDEFAKAYSASGLRPEALQSSYAMAENVFAVTQSETGREPHRLWVDGRRLRDEHVAVPLNPTSEGALCLVSSGRCLPTNEVRIVSAEAHDLPPGTVGEILIRSSSLFDGYYNRPDLTAGALRDGWYRSGDYGFLLTEELYVIGRKKDLIIVGGKNIYPQDVEEIVCGHADIHDGRAVSFGLFNDKLGTEDIVVVAEVEKEETLANSLAIENALRAAIVAELGVAVRAVYLKPPRWIVKSTAGKPARSTSRTKLLSEHPELAASHPQWEFTHE